VISAWESWQSARAEVEARKTQIEASRLAREGVYEEEQVGTRTVLDTLDADQELLNAEVSAVSARRNEIVARFALAAELGLLIPETLGFAEVQENYDRHLNAVKHAIFTIKANPSGDE
jgi:outer membrane protein TolC